MKNRWTKKQFEAHQAKMREELRNPVEGSLRLMVEAHQAEIALERAKTGSSVGQEHPTIKNNGPAEGGGGGGSESLEQQALFKMIHLHEQQYPLLKRVFHVPNGGLRNKVVAGKLKAEGVRPGVPDIFVDVVVPADVLANGTLLKRFSCPGLRIEMKYGRNKPTDNQQEMLDYYEQAGYQVAVCYSWIEAWNIIVDYLGYEKLKQE